MRMHSRTQSRDPRRGATLVLVAVMIIVAGGMAALAIDFARIYSGVTELQSSSDAAALAGAHKLMRTPGQSVVADVQAFAAANSAFGATMSLAAADIEGGVYNVNTGVFTTGAWSTANAVRVTSRRTTTSAFGRLMGLTQLNPARRAVAWVGNQGSQDCIKPWGIDLSYLTTLIGQNITTEAGVSALRTQASTVAGQRAVTVIAGPDVNNNPGRPLPTVYKAMTGANNSSRKSYENAIRGQSCDAAADYTVGGVESVQPGNGLGDIPRTTADAVEAAALTCRVRANATDAACYDPVTNAEGVDVTVGAVTGVSANSATLNAFVGFKLMCVFRGSTGNGNGPAQSALTTESCPWLTRAGVSANNYVRGTIVGYPVVSVAKTGIGNSLGNTIGPARKLVLVQ